MSPGDSPNFAIMPGSGPSWTDVCPPVSLLRRIGEDEISEELYVRLERHVETCPGCQGILQSWADVDRIPALSIDPAGSNCDMIDTVDFDVVPAIPGFRLIRELGRGGEGVVHLAEESETQRLVALKFLPGGWMANPAGRSRWLRQVRATARIQHTNVVRLYRIEETSQWYVMVLEYVSGGTLRDRVHEPLAPEVATALVQRLAMAVEEIHRAGVWHLDLKPSNVLMEGSRSTTLEKCVPKISDFGIALRNELGATESSCSGGTPAFMAPEQAERGSRLLGPATDVYGLGAILFYLLTARPPFEASSTRELIERARTSPLQFPEGAIDRIDPRLIAICRKSMARNPARRYAGPGILANELGRWIDGISGTRPAQEIPKNHEKKGRWRARMAMAAGSGVLFATSIGTGWRWMNQSRPAESARAMSKTEWIQELRQVEPSVFFGSRLERLIASSRIRTDEILNGASGDEEEIARTGMMLQATAARFCASSNKELFETADDLLDCAVRLLKRSHEIEPINQVTIRELAIAEFSFGNLKSKDLEADEAAIVSKFQDDVRHFERATFWIDRITDRRSRTHLASQILDRSREQARISKLKGLSKAVSIWDTFHRKCEARWAELADSEEIRLRMALYDRREFDPVRPETPPRPESALDARSRSLLERELIMYRLEPLVFRSREMTAEPDEAEISAVLDDTERLLERMGRAPDMILSIAFEELIRPVAAVSTWYRAQGKWSVAQVLAERYRRIGKALERRYPERYESYLTLSESYLQEWKNALKAENPASAEAALRVSLEMAHRAIRFEPGSVTARAMLEDRESRLARYQADRE